MAQFLREAELIVDTAATGDEGLWAASENPVHILIISARDGLEDRPEALDSGADDYLVKPFPLAEALPRLRVLLRRSYAKKAPVLKVADLQVDPIRRLVLRANREINLTDLRCRLLEYLIHRADEMVSRADIREHVFEDISGGTSNSVDVYIGYLRKKLCAQGETNLIHTRRGLGYTLKEDEP